MPDVRTSLYCLQLENTHLGGSNAGFRLFLRQKLAFLAISKVLAPTRGGGVLIKQDSVCRFDFFSTLVTTARATLRILVYFFLQINNFF